MLKAIFIDAGHGLGPTGGIDNGASGNGTTERKEVVEMAQELFARLTADASFAGIRIIKVGVDDRMMLKDHIKQVNDECKANGWGINDAMLVSLHINSAGDSSARGLEAWYSKEEGTLEFAKLLIEQISSLTGLPIRPRIAITTDQNRHGRLGIIDDTIPPGVLIECGFITNEFDAAVFKDMNLDDKFAEGIQRALRSYLALPVNAGTQKLPSFYSDVPDLAWFHGDVKKCLDEGLFKMSPDGLFHPERPVTRAEFAAVMARHLFRHHGI